MTTFGSVCSGIEAASVAWAPLGWRAAWLAEIESAPSALLAHHYPDVPNHGDMTQLPHLIRDGFVPAPDVFCGGTPCQAFSVAGLRNSLDDARGNLSLTFCEIADEIDARRAADGLLPAIVFWENVPGVLNTKDNAFGCFLGALAGEDCALEPAGGKWTNAGCVFGPARAVAWRVLDAQYFGVAQRRRRVFVVASARNGFDPTAVLFESEGVRRDSAPSRGQGQNPAAGTLRSTDAGSDIDHARASHLQPVVSTLDASYGRLQGCSGQDMNHGHSHLVPLAFGGNNQSGPIDVATARNACSSGSGRLDFETETFLVQTAPIAFMADDYKDGTFEECDTARPLTTSADRTRAAPVCVTGQVTHTLTAEGHDASEDGSGRGQPIVAATLDAAGGRSRGAGTPVGMLASSGMAVRRLTPRECERLQGFPDVIDQLTITICKNEDEKIALAKYAGLDSVARKHVQNAPVAAHVLIDYGQQLLQLRSAGKLILSASTAETQSASLLRMPPADFVQLIALTRPCLETGMQAGRVASPGSTSSSIAPSSGSAHVLLYGHEISELASDAEAFTDALLQCMKSITSHPGRNSQHCDSTLQTLSCCVAAAISGCIPEKMRSENFSLMVEVVTPYTLIPVRGKPMADGPRYKALGNSWAVPNVRWIGRRIQAEMERAG